MWFNRKGSSHSKRQSNLCCPFLEMILDSSPLIESIQLHIFSVETDISVCWGKKQQFLLSYCRSLLCPLVFCERRHSEAEGMGSSCLAKLTNGWKEATALIPRPPFCFSFSLFLNKTHNYWCAIFCFLALNFKSMHFLTSVVQQINIVHINDSHYMYKYCV